MNIDGIEINHIIQDDLDPNSRTVGVESAELRESLLTLGYPEVKSEPRVLFVATESDKLALETAMRLNGAGGFDVQVCDKLPKLEPEHVVMVGGRHGGKSFRPTPATTHFEPRSGKGDRVRKRKQYKR